MITRDEEAAMRSCIDLAATKSWKGLETSPKFVLTASQPTGGFIPVEAKH
jgi:hypothetical protein